MKKQEKSFFVENLTEELKSASSVILVDYSGMSVQMQQNLKNKLKQVNAKMNVVKNTLFKIAATNAKSPQEVITDTVLEGPIALIITEGDPIAPLQILHKFAKEFELPNLKVGIVEGNFQDRVSLEKLAQLPGKEVLYAQVVATIASPMSQTVAVMKNSMQKLIIILDQASKK